MWPTQLVRRNGRGFDNSLSLGDDVNRALAQWWGDGGETGVPGVYPVDIREDENHIYVDAELPGFKNSEVEVTLENGLLHIQAERKEETEPKGEVHLRERRFTRVSRSFSMPNTVDEKKVEAALQNGVLHLTLNKREEVKPKKIAIK